MKIIQLNDLAQLGMESMRFHESATAEFCGIVMALSENSLTEYGKKEWADVLDAKVERMRGSGESLVVYISQVETKRLKQFTKLLAGECPVIDYERCVAHPNKLMAADHEKPETSLYTPEVVNLIASYEYLLNIPAQERMTRYFADEGGYFVKKGATDSRVETVFKKALDTIGMTESEYFSFCREEVHDRKDVELRMRGRLIVNTLSEEEPVDIVYINTIPIGGPGDYYLQSGKIKQINKQTNPYTVQLSGITNETIPLKNIVGVVDEQYTRTYSNTPRFELLYGATVLDINILLEQSKQAEQIGLENGMEGGMSL